MCARARRTTNALDAQIKRHLLSASSEISAATTKRFKVVEASLLDPVAYALRDGMANDMPLSNGGRGYPLGYPENLDSWDFPPPPAPTSSPPGKRATRAGTSATTAEPRRPRPAPTAKPAAPA